MFANSKCAQNLITLFNQKYFLANIFLGISVQKKNIVKVNYWFSIENWYSSHFSDNFVYSFILMTVHSNEYNTI